MLAVKVLFFASNGGWNVPISGILISLQSSGSLKSNGELLGPKKVWLKILFIIETWISTQLEKELSSLKMLREIYS